VGFATFLEQSPLSPVGVVPGQALHRSDVDLLFVTSRPCYALLASVPRAGSSGNSPLPVCVFLPVIRVVLNLSEFQHFEDRLGTTDLPLSPSPVQNRTAGGFRRQTIEDMSRK
jgi:hypothetical protein